MLTIEIPSAYATNPETERAYLLGRRHGHGIACHNVPSIGDAICRSIDWVGLGKTVTAENAKEYHELLCFAAESSSRDYSPFEFVAHEFNESEDSEDLWAAFEAGVSDSIHSDLSAYSIEDYSK